MANGNYHQGPISSMFYEKLLHKQIPKVQKRHLNCQYFFALWGSTLAKAARKTLVKIGTWLVILGIHGSSRLLKERNPSK